MTDMERPQDAEQESPIWPQPGSVPPSFESARDTAEFLAGQCGLTIEDLQFEDAPDPDSPNHALRGATAWFPGIPQTALFCDDRAKDTYRPTDGATRIVRKIQTGEWDTDYLTTPYQPPAPNPLRLPSFVLGPNANFSGFFDITRTPLLRPEDAGEIDEREEAVGTIEVVQGEDVKEPVVTLILEDGKRLPFTDVAARQLERADQKVANLNGKTGVFRVSDVPDPASGTIRMIKRDGSEAPIPGDEDRFDPTIRAVVEVYLEGE